MRFAGDLVEHARAFVVLSAELDVPGNGAFERAARKLHVDTSVLRRRVQALSEHAGGELMAGRGRELRLTPLGTRIRTLASELLDRATAMHTRKDPPERIVIGCTEAISSDLLPRPLGALLRRAPSLAVAVRRLGTEECIARLALGEVDLGIVRGALHDERWPPGLDAKLIARDRLWLAVGARHPLARPKKARSVRLRDIANEPLVLYGAASATRRRVMNALAPLGGRVILEVEGRVAALSYARMGLGVAFLSALPETTLRFPGVALRDVTRLFPASGFWLLVPRVRTPRVAELAELLTRPIP
jgi:DNA-binding transcriptional LysR family regulator